MVVRSFRLIACIGVLLGIANGQSALPGQGNTSHGVSGQYQKGDSFPIYKAQAVRVGNGTPYYDPPEITVDAGDLVEWINAPLSDTHTIIDIAGHFESPAVAAGKNWCYHFVQEGDYQYSCRFHPWMKGLVHVRRRTLPLEPLRTSSPAEAGTAGRAGPLLSNAHALETADGGYWMAGIRPGILEYRDPVRRRSESIRVPEASGVVRPLAVVGNRVLLGVPGLLLAFDSRTKSVADKLVLPKAFVPALAAAASDDELWAVDPKGTTLLSVNLETKSVRAQALPAGSRVISVQQNGSTVWALDAGRNLLLKLGTDWINEVPLPPALQRPTSMAVDPDGQPWILDPHHGIVGVLLPNGFIQEFAASHFSGTEVLERIGVDTLVIAARGGRLSKIVLEAVKGMAAKELSQCQRTITVQAAGGSTAAEARKPQ